MTTTTLAGPESEEAVIAGLRNCVEDAIRRTPNHDLLQCGLEDIATTDELVCFLHRFLHFNDALAARVPYLAGRIHLHPELFCDPEEPEEFCQRRNALVSAYIAEAANDEYRMTPGGSLVHQRLSQLFFRAVLRHFGLRGENFDHTHPMPSRLKLLLQEARTCFFEDASLETVGQAIGFHVGLEFYADQEFNLVDSYLRKRHPVLVESLQVRPDGDAPPYLWLSLHTVVEIGHYRAGLSAIEGAVRFCSPRAMAPRMASAILSGLDAFAKLQRRFYQSVLPG